LRAFCLAVLISVLCLRVATYATADRAGPGYLGAWTLAAAVDAPWATRRAPDSAGRVRLIGRTVVFKPEAIAGPAPFACAGPRYRLRDIAAARIFQGAFEQMQAASGAPDPDALAAAFGFSGPSIKTLETGCHIDVHFVDASTAQIGLNDTIYTLKRH